MFRYRISMVCLVAALGAGCEALPDAQLPTANGTELKVLDQGWTAAQRAQFAHGSQGSVLMPYKWLMALEQPEVKFVGTVGLFMDDSYIGRFGFLPDRPMPAHQCKASDNPGDPNYNCGLPVGFSRTLLDERALSIPGIVERDVVGLTCSACHTGELHYDGKALRIAGASAQIDPTSFQNALAGALLLTQRLPFRFNRFADRVLPPDATTEQRAALRAQLDTYLDASTPEIVTAARKGLYGSYPGGFGRTDALARITNMVFGTEMHNDDNLVVGNAPVKFPQIWDSPYFAWAQYNDAIEQSMTRNIGEALGVRAKVHYSSGEALWDGEGLTNIQTTVDVGGLMGLETLLRGKPGEYFAGLRSPVWPEGDLQPIAWDDARKGKELYHDRCAGCHHPPLADLVELDPQTRALRPKPDMLPDYWVSNNDPSMLSDLAPGPWPEGERRWLLALTRVDLGSIGTDPGQATNFARNIVNTKKLLLPAFPKFSLDAAGVARPQTQFPERVMPAGVGLQKVTIAIANAYFDGADAMLAGPDGLKAFGRTLPPNLREADGTPLPFLIKNGRVNRALWNGFRVPGAVANPVYHAPPLNGIWASPPYLHNGSVPTIDALLSPLEQRPKVFYVGSREYDPAHLGYRTDRFRGAFKYDTGIAGNANTGHRFENLPKGNGVIGSALDATQRHQVIEYLKTLCPPGRWTDYTRKAERLCAATPPAAESQLSASR